MRSRHLTGDRQKKKRVKSTERHLVFKVLFLQVLHKRDHFVDDWIQHWLEERQTLHTSHSEGSKTLMKNSTAAANCSSKCTVEKHAGDCWFVTAHLDDVGV